MFAKWREADNNISYYLNEQGVPPTDDAFRPLPPSEDGNESPYIRHRERSVSVKRSLTDAVGPSRQRQMDLCSKYTPRFEDNGRFPIQDQFSVLVSFYSEDRLQTLVPLVEHYLNSTL